MQLLVMRKSKLRSRQSGRFEVEIKELRDSDVKWIIHVDGRGGDAR